jgi:hypothetical protein
VPSRFFEKLILVKEDFSMSLSSSVLPLIAGALSFVSLAGGLEADPTAEQLISLAPVIRSSDAAVRSIRVTGCAEQEGGVNVRFYALYQAPGRYMSCFLDGTDDTPIFFHSGGKMLIYNSIDNYIAYTDFSYIELSVAQSDEDLHFQLGLTKTNEKDSGGLFSVDLRSLYGAPARDGEATRIGAKEYSLKRATKRGSLMIASLDLTRSRPFHQFEVYSTSKRKPSLSITIDEDAEVPWVAMPPKELLGKRIGIKDWSKDRLPENAATLAYIVRACNGRLAIRDKNLRNDFESRYGVHVDWKKVEMQDRRISQALREELKPAIDLLNKNDTPRRSSPSS